MIFSQKELASVTKVATAMAKADGHLDKEETSVICSELMSFGIDTDEFMTIVAKSRLMDASDAFKTISSMSMDKKQYVSGFLVAIMISDGKIDPDEVKMWVLISSLAQLPETTADKALLYYSNHKS